MKKEGEQSTRQDKKIGRQGYSSQIMALFFLVFFTAITFYPSLHNGFTNWDDAIYVINNPYIKKLSLENIQHIFTEAVSNNYNPLTILSFALERNLLGNSPKIYHTTNLILHIFCSISVFWLAQLLGLRLFGAVLLAFLFSIHPLRVESVAWITERKDVLFAFFYLAAIISYIFYSKKEKNKFFFYYITLILFILSLLAKIQAVALPLTLLVIDIYFARKISWTKKITEKIPFFTLSLITGLVGLYFLEDTLDVTQNFAFYERFLLGSYALLVYLYKLFIPFPLSAYYPYPDKINNWLPIIYYTTPLFIFLFTYLIYRSKKYRKALVFGSLFFLVNIVFVLQIVQAGEAFLADRFTYIPYIGLCFIIAFIGEKFFYQKHFSKYILIVITSLYIVGLAYLTHQQCKVWYNSETLWSHVIQQYPEQVSVAYNNRGNFYRQQGQTAQALTDYNKAISLDFNYHLAYVNRGNIHYDNKKYDKAYADYHKALKLKANNTEALNNLAAIYFQKGHYKECINYASKAIDLNKNYTDAYRNRAVAYAVQKQFAKAKQDYDQYLRLQANDFQVLHWRGIAHREIGNLQASVKDFEQVLRLNPNYAAAHLELSYTYHALKQWNLALKNVQKAIQLGEQVKEDYLFFLEKKLSAKH